ncbi:ankyrin repeat domain-containing protein [Candidatus Chromulinivorax destructor]|uniref:Uncharacterized protein n=1 Tax=Candidatus Chromulinivorax destructor TaxID=2066483 RepID=A0A345ZCZ0_9BACT|nr:ankyrin repeat domain-containing protein [Candidatus Chromulinivorax destructor]AXK61157.1 hypothetical protein C0J27_05505 [Candidatus Chromulinivorax destructor]
MNKKFMGILSGMLLLTSFVSAENGYLKQKRDQQAAEVLKNNNYDLYQATSKNDLAKISSLIRGFGANVNYIYLNGHHATSSLHIAVQSNFIEAVKLLVECGANINIKDSNQMTPLYEAKSKEMIQVLIDLKADVNCKEQQGLTPLHYLSSCGHQDQLEMIRLLVRAGSDINCRSGGNSYRGPWNGLTPLHRCHSDMKVIQLLIDLGADLNSRDCEGNTSLHNAGIEKARILINNKANVNSQNNKGQTPLHLVASINHYAMGAVDAISHAQLLIKSGANINAKDVNDKTPFQYAQTEEMRNLLNKKIDNK